MGNIEYFHVKGEGWELARGWTWDLLEEAREGGGHSWGRDGACWGSPCSHCHGLAGSRGGSGGGCRPSTPSPSSASLALGYGHRQRRMGNTTSHFAGLKSAIGSCLLCLSLLLALFIGGVTPQIVVCTCSFSPIYYYYLISV